MEDFAFLFPFFFIGIFAFLIPRIQGKMFKELKENFNTDENFPAENFRIPRLQYGNIKINNSAKIAENIQSLFLLVPFKTVIKIPFTELAEIKIENAFLGQKAVILRFKRPGIKSMVLVLNKNTLAQLPNLMKLAQNHQPEQSQSRIQYPTQARNQGRMPFIKPNAGNTIRGIILAVALGSGILALIGWYLLSY